MRRGAVAVLVVLLAVAGEAGTVKKLELADGYSDYNTIREPVFAPPPGFTLAVGSIEAGYDRQGQILRQLSKGVFTRGVKAEVDPAIDLAALLAEAVRAEAVTMGLPAGEGAATYTVTGRLHDIFLESKQVPYGPTLFYGFMDVTMEVAGRGGSARELRFRLHNNFLGMSLGLTRKGEAADALLRFLVESAQEIVARLNREVFHVPPAPTMAAKRAGIGSGAKLAASDVRLLGLSGDGEAASVLLRALPKQTSVRDRVQIIVALANLGAESAVEPLAARYDTEDEDCRFAILKALDYIGGEGAVALIKTKGVNDRDDACRSLAARL